MVVALTVSGDASLGTEDGIEAEGIGNTGKWTASDAPDPVETAVNERDGTTVAGETGVRATGAGRAPRNRFLAFVPRATGSCFREV
ncbi:MAG: hypothetical protein V5A44_00725 [Haloarculaceae archaeon]